MRKFLNKNLKVNIPFLSVKGSATLTKVTEMNDIQSRVALLIICHKELGISSETLGNAIQQVYGLIPNNQPVILKDILQLVETKTINTKLGDKSILDMKVQLLELKMNKGIKQDILVKDIYSLMTSDTRRVNKKLAIEMFDGFGIIENPTFTKQEELVINSPKTYSIEQYKDLVEQHVEVRKNETLNTVSLDSDEATIAWISNDLNVEIGDEITAVDNKSERVLELLTSGNVEISPSALINDEINSLKLKHTNKAFAVTTTPKAEELLSSSKAIDTKYKLEKYGIKKFYETSFKTLLDGKAIEIKEVVSEDETFAELFSNKGDKFTIDILNGFKPEAKVEFIKSVSKGAKASIEIMGELLDVLSIKQFKELSDEELKRVIPTRELFGRFFDKNVTKLKADKELITKLFRLNFVKEEWLVKHVAYQYGKDRLFEGWKAETVFFNILEENSKLEINKMTKGEIEEVIAQFEKDVPELFAGQTLVKEMKTKMTKAIKNAAEWSSDKILAEGMRTRSKLEDFISDNYKGEVKFGMNRIAAEATFKPKYAKALYESYKELSDVVAHEISKTSDLKKEKTIKACIAKLDLIYSKELKDLKLEVKKPKKEGK